MEPYIFLVEDNPADIELLKIAFEDAGDATVINSVRDGREARSRLQEKVRADLCMIVLDINVPSISGLDLLDLIKHDLKWADIPTVMLTSSDRKQDRERACALHIDAYLVKPRDYAGYGHIVRELVACMERRVGHRWEP